MDKNIEELKHILNICIKQYNYEMSCNNAYRIIFNGSITPVTENYLWKLVYKLFETKYNILGEDFIEWWIWETECGKKNNKIIIKGNDNIEKSFNLSTINDICDFYCYMTNNK